MAYAGRDLLRVPDEPRTFAAGGRLMDLGSFLTLHRWKGRHQTRGVIMAVGPEVRHRYSGAWMISGPYASLFRQIDGLVSGTLTVGRLLRRLHVLDEATVLDLAPTVLYLAEVPVSEDMDGRVLTQFISRGLLSERPIRTVPDYALGEVADVPSASAEQDRLRARLKALGYVH